MGHTCEGFYNYFSENQLLTELAKHSFDKILKKEPKKDKGLLIVFEGIDGAGKTSQVFLLRKWLEDHNYDVTYTEWNSSEVVKRATDEGKNKRELTPLLYALLHAADLIHRYEQIILPALDKNRVVIADRYVYTSSARDKVRGVDLEILKNIYQGLREPDILFHCVVPIHIAFTRMLREKGLSYYGTGSDLNLADSREENYVKYENMLNKAYCEILPSISSYHKLNMNRTKKEIFKDVLNVLSSKFGIGKYK
jgi:dTMP kinase